MHLQGHIFLLLVNLLAGTSYKCWKSPHVLLGKSRAYMCTGTFESLATRVITFAQGLFNHSVCFEFSEFEESISCSYMRPVCGSETFLSRTRSDSQAVLCLGFLPFPLICLF